MAQNDCLKVLLDKGHEETSPKALLKASPSALAGVTEQDAKALQDAFGIKTIEDLATNKFVLWAQAIHTLARFEK